MNIPAKDLVQLIFQKCAGKSGCEVCRPHMEEDCLFFPELYRLNDEMIEKGKSPESKHLGRLLDLCTLCGLCPCQNIRMLILAAKAAFAKEEGLTLSSGFLSDVEKAGRIGTKFPNTANFLNTGRPFSIFTKKLMKIHNDRCLPVFPRQSFFRWAQNKGLHHKKKSESAAQKVAYFAGCSAGYLYPEVGKATVNLLEKTGAEVFVPEQHCCSMPLLMEGQREKAMEKIRANVATLIGAVRDGYQLVYSCPTCGYFYKKLLLENAYYSDAFQEKLKAENNIMKIPFGSGTDTFISLPKNIYQKILKDDGYFSSIDPLDRIELSQKGKDLGEYLLSFCQENKSLFRINGSQMPMLYFPPCHQREQEIGQPYFKILSSILGTDIRQVGGALDCCGMGGHLGYKKSFHPSALKLGRPLFEKLIREEHRTIVTDCLSCRMQFEQQLPMKVYHPAEVLSL
ncbi:MAG: FeS-binding protein [Desulfobacula sp.]|jgi:glycerol-3-phosphate dehydrogenase subunit C|nr:FeS-binding protein [Desulfobacula sp.]